MSYFNLFLAFILSATVLVAVSITADYVAAFLSISLFLTGTWLFKGRGLKFFYLAYAFNLLSAVVITNYYFATTGQVFTDIKDDVFFYNSSTELAQAFVEGKWHEYANYTRYSGFGYILICGFFFYLISFVSDFDPSYIQIINSFVGATMAPAIYLIGKHLFLQYSVKIASRAALLVAFFPIFTYYSAIVVRDIWIASLAVWFIYVLLIGANQKKFYRNQRIKEKRKDFWFLIVWPSLIVFLVGIFRPHSMVPLIFIWFFMVFLEDLSWRVLFYKFTFLVASLFMIGALGVSLVDQFGEEMNTYERIVAEQSTGGSLGRQILQSPTPINEIARFVYTIYTPVPPIKDLELKSIYIGIGSIIWYFAIPFLYFGFKASLKRKEIKYKSMIILIYVLITVFGIMLTSIDVRHKTMIFAVCLLYASAVFTFFNKKMIIKIAAVYSFFMGMLAIVYLALKAY